MSGKGHNSHKELRDLVENIERLDERIADFNTEKSETYTRAKSLGYDLKALRTVISRRRIDQGELQERDALIDIYENALKGMVGTKPATRARARKTEAEGDDE